MRTGTIANSIKRQISFFIQSRFLSCKYAITPVIPNSGSHPATEAHLQFDSGVKYFDVPELNPDHLPSSIEFPVNKVETEDDTVKIPLPDDIITKMVEEVEDAEVSYLDFFSTPSVDSAFPRKRGRIQTDGFKKLLAVGGDHDRVEYDVLCVVLAELPGNSCDDRG